MENMSQTEALAQFEPAVYKYARQWHNYKAIKGEFELEDLAQIGRMYVLYALEDYNPSKDMKLSSYVIQRIRWGLNTALRAYMKTSHGSTVSIDAMNVERSDQWHPITHSDPITFDLLISELPSELRRMVTLRYMDGMTLQQIGEAEGVSHEWARQQIQKALTLMEI